MSYQFTDGHHADGNHGWNEIVASINASPASSEHQNFGSNSATQIGSGWDDVVADINHKQASAAGITRSDKQRPQTRIGHGWDEILASVGSSKSE